MSSFSQNELLAKIENLLKQNDLIICISGRSCSGKSTLAENIKNSFPYYSSSILCEDSWYKNIEDISVDDNGFKDMECENAFYINELKKDIQMLLNDKIAYVPNYNIPKNIRMHKETKVNFSRLTILEGLHTVDIFKDLDKIFWGNVLYIYVKTSLYTCRERRIIRDTREYMIRQDFVYNFYTNVVEKHYQPYIDKQKNIIEIKGEKGILYG